MRERERDWHNEKFSRENENLSYLIGDLRSITKEQKFSIDINICVLSSPLLIIISFGMFWSKILFKPKKLIVYWSRDLSYIRIISLDHIFFLPTLFLLLSFGSSFLLLINYYYYFFARILPS